MKITRCVWLHVVREPGIADKEEIAPQSVAPPRARGIVRLQLLFSVVRLLTSL